MKKSIITGVILYNIDEGSSDDDRELQFVYNPGEDIVDILLDGVKVAICDWSNNLREFCAMAIKYFGDSDD